MNFKVWATGSKGNLYTLEPEPDFPEYPGLIIEAGIPLSRIKKLLGAKLTTKYSGVLISHEHKDHALAVKELVWKTALPIYSAGKTFKSIYATDPYIPRRCNSVHPGQRFVVGIYEVLAFPVKHDAVCPLGFIVRHQATQETLIFATDLRDFKGLKFKNKFALAAIECNYDDVMLTKSVWDGNITKEVAERIKKNHLGVSDVVSFLDDSSSDIHRLVLLHYSQTNIDIGRTARGLEKLWNISVEIGGMKNVKEAIV